MFSVKSSIGSSFGSPLRPIAASIIARELPAVGSFSYLGKEHSDVAKAVIEAGAEWSQPMWLLYESGIIMARILLPDAARTDPADQATS